MTLIRGFITLPKQYHNKIEDAIEYLSKKEIDVYEFKNYIRKGQKSPKSSIGIFFNGNSKDNISSKSILDFFFNTTSHQNEPGIYYDISDIVWPIYTGTNPQNYYALRLFAPSKKTALDAILKLSKIVNFETSSYRLAEAGVIVYETFNHKNLDKIMSEFKKLYIPDEDTFIENIQH